MKRIIRDLAVFAGFYALFAFIFVLILSLFIQGYKYFTGNEGRIEGFLFIVLIGAIFAAFYATNRFNKS